METLKERLILEIDRSRADIRGYVDGLTAEESRAFALLVYNDGRPVYKVTRSARLAFQINQSYRPFTCFSINQPPDLSSACRHFYATQASTSSALIQQLSTGQEHVWTPRW